MISGSSRIAGAYQLITDGICGTADACQHLWLLYVDIIEYH